MGVYVQVTVFLISLAHYYNRNVTQGVSKYLNGYKENIMDSLLIANNNST